jgi:hypothetical protein
VHVRVQTTLAALALGVLLPAAAAAQDFGVMNSAETINRGNFKIMGNPIVVFGEDDADSEVGVAIVGGFGFTERFDVEAKLSLFDGLTFIGADAEFWLLKEQPIDVSVIGGLHVADADGFDAKGFDVTFLASGHVSPKVELYGGLDIARNSFDDSDVDFTTYHLVPGIEYAFRDDIDFVAEIGFGLNDHSNNYFSAGIAFYLR